MDTERDWTASDKVRFLKRVREVHGGDPDVASYCDRVVGYARSPRPSDRGPVHGLPIEATWVPEKVTEVRRLCAKGMSVKDIAAAVDESENRVKSLINALGLRPHHKRRK